MLAFLQEKLVALVLPLIVAPLAALATQLTKRAWAWLDRQHPIVKQVWAALYAAMFAWIAAEVGTAICADGSSFCEAPHLDWGTIFTYGFAGALALHGWKKKE